MSGNTVNLNFFLAKNGVSWENIGITKPNTECIAGQASTPASPRPSSRSSIPQPSSSVSKRSSKSPTSEARQQAARSLIRKWSPHQGSLERRKYLKAPKSPFASTFHIKNSPSMSDEKRRKRTTDITRYRKYIKERTYDLAEDAASKAREAAEKLWAAHDEAMNAAMAAEAVAEQAEKALAKLQEGKEGSVDDPGAGDDQAPNETISMDRFPEHKNMLDCGANQIAAGFADLVGREFDGRSDADSERSLEESEDELRQMKRLLPPLQRKDRATERAISHARSLKAKGEPVSMGLVQAMANKAAREVKAGSMNVQAAIRKVRADRWSLKKSGELEKEKSRLSKVHMAE